MAINPASAAMAYTKALEQAGAAKAAGAGEGDFGTLLGQAMNMVSESAKAGEAGIAAGTTGKGDMIDVVTAVSAAEVTLETVIAVRDRVINAYQEVMKMPI